MTSRTQDKIEAHVPLHTVRVAKMATLSSRARAAGLETNALHKLNRCNLYYSFALILKSGPHITLQSEEENSPADRVAIDSRRSSAKSGEVTVVSPASGEPSTLESTDVHIQIVQTLEKAELEVAFLQCEDKQHDEDRVVLLIRADDQYGMDAMGRRLHNKSLLQREHAKLFLERYLTLGEQSGGKVPEVCFLYQRVVLCC